MSGTKYPNGPTQTKNFQSRIIETLKVSIMQSSVDKIFEDTGLRWISGYELPHSVSGDSNGIVYVAQLAIKTNDKGSHEVIKWANLEAWLFRDPVGQKVAAIAEKNSYQLAFQMVPHQPGHAYLNCFIKV
jgi:hypothetical protein